MGGQGASGCILASLDDDGVARFTISRPDRRNAFTTGMMHALREHLERLQPEPSCRVLLLRGEGACFSAGGDVHEFAQSLPLQAPARLASFQALVENRVNPVILALRAAHQPVLAAVRGDCVGYGLSLMLASDIAIAAEDALFSTAGIGLAQPGAGGQSYFLVRALGERRARELMWSARRFDAHEARALGLVEQVVPVPEFEAAVAQRLAQLVAGPRHAWAEIKRLLVGSGQQAVEQGAAPASSPLAAQLADEAAAFGRCAATDDFAEAVSAFLERRSPVFRGR